MGGGSGGTGRSELRIAGPGFVVRPWRASDREALCRNANHRSVWRNLTDRFPFPYTPADADSWLALTAQQGHPPLNCAIALEPGDEACGGIGLQPKADLERQTAQIGYWLGPAHHGRGIATAALRLMTTYAFDTFGFERLEAAVLEWNPASCRVLEKAGYAAEGRLRRSASKDGQVVDTFLYALARDDRRP